MPGATFDPYDVVVVPFPFTDRPAAKRRPALVVSDKGFNGPHAQLILAMITSSQSSDWPSDVRLERWQAAGLTTACRVRMKLFTLDKTLVVSRLGVLAAEDRRCVSRMVSACLAIA